MKKNLLFVAALTTALTAGTCPVSAVSIPVKAESSETSVLGTWYGNVWGTPAIMTLGADGDFSMKIPAGFSRQRRERNASYLEY